MINKSQIMTWRNIGYDAQELICRCDSNASVEKLAEMAETIREKMNRLDISELKKAHTEKNIAFTEYADILGHSSINTTRIYTIENGETHRRQMQKLGLVCMKA